MVYKPLSKYFHRRNDEHDIGEYCRTNRSTMVLTHIQMLRREDDAVRQ